MLFCDFPDCQIQLYKDYTKDDIDKNPLKHWIALYARCYYNAITETNWWFIKVLITQNLSYWRRYKTKKVSSNKTHPLFTNIFIGKISNKKLKFPVIYLKNVVISSPKLHE